MAQDFQMQVAEMYRKYEVLIEKVQKYDVLMVDVANLSAKVDDYQNALSGVMMMVNDKFKDMTALIGLTNESIKNIDVKIDNNKVEFADFMRKNSQVMVDVDANHKAIHHFAEKTHARLTDHASNSASKDEIISMKKASDDAANSLAMQLRQVSSRLDKMQADLDVYSSSQRYLEEKIKNTEGAIEFLTVIVDKQRQSFEDNLKSLSQAVPAQVQNYSKPLLNRFDEMQKLVESIPSTKEIRDELVPKIELLSMDCRNGALKLENHEQKLKFMEKQLENTNLRVGKVELKP